MIYSYQQISPYITNKYNTKQEKFEVITDLKGGYPI